MNWTLNPMQSRPAPRLPPPLTCGDDPVDPVATVAAVSSAAMAMAAATDSAREALAALYDATDGPNWKNGDEWLSDAPLGEWHGIGEFFIDRFRGSGGAVVANESYERGATDFAVQLARIAAATPGAVFVPVRAEDVALLAAQARASPVHDPAGEPALFLGADAWDNPALLDNGGAAVEGSFFSSHFSPDTDEPTARAHSSTPTGRGTESRPRAATR